MANPLVVDISSEKTVENIATAVQTGVIWKIIADVEYFYTYRLTGEAAPTYASDRAEFVRVFKDDDESDNQILIQASGPIDIYMFTVGGAGQVRADL